MIKSSEILPLMSAKLSRFTIGKYCLVDQLILFILLAVTLVSHPYTAVVKKEVQFCIFRPKEYSACTF